MRLAGSDRCRDYRDLASRLTFNAAGSTGGWTETAPGSGIYEFNVGALASGPPAAITFSVIVDDPLAAGVDNLVNNVSIADDGTNGPDERSHGQ